MVDLVPHPQPLKRSSARAVFGRESGPLVAGLSALSVCCAAVFCRRACSYPHSPSRALSARFWGPPFLPSPRGPVAFSVCSRRPATGCFGPWPGSWLCAPHWPLPRCPRCRVLPALPWPSAPFLGGLCASSSWLPSYGFLWLRCGVSHSPRVNK